MVNMETMLTVITRRVRRHFRKNLHDDHNAFDVEMIASNAMSSNVQQRRNHNKSDNGT